MNTNKLKLTDFQQSNRGVVDWLTGKRSQKDYKTNTPKLSVQIRPEKHKGFAVLNICVCLCLSVVLVFV